MSFRSSQWSPPVGTSKQVMEGSTYDAAVETCLGAKVLVFANAIQDGVISNIRTRGEWERETFEAADLILSKIEKGSVIDVGANCGAFVLPLAKRNLHKKEVSFHAFEPQRMIFHQLCGGAALNGLTNIKIHNYGCGTHKHTVDIPLPEYTRNSSGYSMSTEVMEKLRTEEYHNYCYEGDVESLEIVDIDSLGLKDVVLMKIDVEGMEEDVLKGASKTIEDSGYPVILYESWQHNWRKEISSRTDEYVKSLGYETHKIDLETVVCFHPENKVWFGW